MSDKRNHGKAVAEVPLLPQLQPPTALLPGEELAPPVPPGTSAELLELPVPLDAAADPEADPEDEPDDELEVEPELEPDEELDLEPLPEEPEAVLLPPLLVPLEVSAPEDVPPLEPEPLLVPPELRAPTRASSAAALGQVGLDLRRHGEARLPRAPWGSPRSCWPR